ncbi:MAG TPA: hypothetical protein PK006_12270 [Saprospiraceae bacterium]|nr:hypothetical protein [Saprospiraceae bacterium]
MNFLIKKKVMLISESNKTHQIFDLISLRFEKMATHFLIKKFTNSLAHYSLADNMLLRTFQSPFSLEYYFRRVYRSQEKEISLQINQICADLMNCKSPVAFLKN